MTDVLIAVSITLVVILGLLIALIYAAADEAGWKDINP